MKKKAIAFMLLFAPVIAYAEEYGASYRTGTLLADEIARHVIDECNLKRTYGKNRIDFDTYNVAVNILPEIHKKMWKEKEQLTGKISAVVHPVRSFAKRAKIYDVYYELCIRKIGIGDAEQQILQYVDMTLTNSYKNDDSIISELYGTLDNRERIERDESRIRILERLNEAESRADTVKKNLSVIQEYRHDIAFWKF